MRTHECTNHFEVKSVKRDYKSSVTSRFTPWRWFSLSHGTSKKLALAPLGPVTYGLVSSSFPLMALTFFFAAISVLVANGDYIQSAIYKTGDCSGNPMMMNAAYTSCISTGTSWAAVTCTSSTSASLVSYSNAQCTGTPLQTDTSTFSSATCISSSTTSSTLPSCVTGTFYPPSGRVAYYYYAA